jgi:hypothetical protein
MAALPPYFAGCEHRARMAARATDCCVGRFFVLFVVPEGVEDDDK